ncbi:MAG TPA: hypothetical protein VIF83_06235 [Gemmatimonadaceae bacterium]|jgi:hypothetical protein
MRVDPIAFLHPDYLKAAVVFEHLRGIVVSLEPQPETVAVTVTIPAYMNALINHLAISTGATPGHATAALFDAGDLLSMEFDELGRRVKFNNDLLAIERDGTVQLDKVTIDMPSKYWSLVLRESLAAQRTTADRWLAASIQTVIAVAIEAADGPQDPQVPPKPHLIA